MKPTRIDELCIAAIRSLCIDETNEAKSGHPGVALGAAPMLYTLYQYHLVSNPSNPNWVNRDRFILSGGHASSLLYALLHVAGYRLNINDLKKFRQINSLTSGHPEYKHTPGVDNTSGPLAQGLSQAVGVAMAELAVAAQYPNIHHLMNHYTYCLVGDGDLEEGLSQEAISLAGHQQLNKLIVLFDSNEITLDGALNLSQSDNVKKRFEASHWNVLDVKDGNDVSAISDAISEAKNSKNRPTLIIVHTIIGYGSKNQGTHKVHGAPLGEEDGFYAKKMYHYDYPKFTVPKEVYDAFKKHFIKRGEHAETTWKKNFLAYQKKHPKEAEIFQDAFKLNIKKYLRNTVKYDDPNLNEATRKTNGNLINHFAKEIPFLVGGAADVASSVNTKINDALVFSPSARNGRNFSFGIREFQMGGVENGMLLHGGLRPYVGCFLVFADYLKASIRIAAMSHLPAIYLFSHDSIYVGEDGPTHQPVEQLAMLRSIPNINVYRPCDARETYGAWLSALISKESPSILILTRQNLPLNPNSDSKKVNDGAYVISKESSKDYLTLIASGSEVSLACKAKEALKGEIDLRIVSMPSMERFNALKREKQDEILANPYNKRIALEALSSFGWHRYAPHVLSIDRFGLSGKGMIVAETMNFSIKDLIKLIKEVKKNG